MKLKERDKGRFLDSIKNSFLVIGGLLFGKNRALIWLIGLMILFLFFGVLIGLFISGFFGTLDNPSRTVMFFVNYFGVHGDALDAATKLDWIVKENVRIPWNFVKGKFSNPERLYIDVGFREFQQIEYKRQLSIEDELLSSSSSDYVPADIRFGDKSVRSDIRLKGDGIDHWGGDKWSFRIKVKDSETLFGMKVFSIQAPETRNFLNEWLFQQTLKKEDVMNVRYKFIEVFINGENKGIFAVEEHFDKQLIEYNEKREGLILRFDDDGLFEELLINEFSHDDEYWEFHAESMNDWPYISNVNTFRSDENTFLDKELLDQFETAREKLELFRTGQLKTSEVFDVDRLARYYAVVTLLGCAHGTIWHNIRFYYNPITGKIEPIGFDGDCGAQSRFVIDSFPECLSQEDCLKEFLVYGDYIFMDEVFFRRYIEELERVSQVAYLDNLFLELEKEIKRNTNIIRKDYWIYHFSKDDFYRNQIQVDRFLNPVESVNANLRSISNGKIILDVGNTGSFPIEIIDVEFEKVKFSMVGRNKILNKKSQFKPVKFERFDFRIPDNFKWENNYSVSLVINYKIFGLDKIHNESIQPWPYIENGVVEGNPNVDSFDFLEIENGNKIIKFKRGSWVVDRNLVIPKGYMVFVEEGTVIDLVDGSFIQSYSPVMFSGRERNLITVKSSDKTGGGLFVLNSNFGSNLDYVEFKDLLYPDVEGLGLTGSVTFYESPVNIDNVRFLYNGAEDSLNIINSDFEIRNSVFENCFSDCFDDDFGNGLIVDSDFIDSGNDAIDVSGGEVRIVNVNVFNAGDKGISAGERSELYIENLDINSNQLSFIGIASKDLSRVDVSDSKISNAKYGIAVYQKKSEFGPGFVEAKNVVLENVEESYITESGSELIIDGKFFVNGQEDVYSFLYF